MSETVEVDRDALESLADYVADDLRDHGGPEMEYLREAVEEAYDVIDG